MHVATQLVRGMGSFFKSCARTPQNRSRPPVRHSLPRGHRPSTGQQGHGPLNDPAVPAQVSG
uniref:Uncharacterized protein n=1 Tax=Streptomyces rochei TaxID=1928 RepID=A0A0U3IZ86_STRRO|nr:hypothetical protein [Streptomyces rochei]